MSNTLCTETKTFKNCGEYIDYVIAQSRKKQQEEREQKQKEFLESIEAIVNFGVVRGIAVGQGLENIRENYPEKTEEEIFTEAVQLTVQETMKTVLKTLN